MNSKRQILITHYTMLVKKAATWAGLVALMGTTMVATPVGAFGTQMGPRSATPSTLKAAATGVTYTISYKVSSTHVIMGTKIEICDSPLETTTCNASVTGGVNSNGASLATASLTTLTGTACNSNAVAASGGTGPGASGTSRIFSNASGNSPTSANACVLTIGTVTNPTGSAVPQKYYLRISNWSDTAATATEYDFGAVALETVSDITVSANVQEAMTFCTGTSGADCGTIAGTTVAVGTTTDNILTNGTPSGAVSTMYIDTNAASGYTITYNAPTLTSGANTIGNPTGTETMAVCAATPTLNGDCFGINAAVNTATGLTASAAPTGGVVPTITGYNTGDSYKFATGLQTFATIAAPTATTTFKVSYAAMAGPTTKTGAYSAIFTWVATGNF
jgi:hypothetical protein